MAVWKLSQGCLQHMTWTNTWLHFFLLSACKTPFGVEWGHQHDRSLVKDQQMTASSTEGGSEPHFGRLEYSSNAWCPSGNMIRDQYSQKNQFLQIDFIIASKVTGVSTQGLGSKYVTFYNLYYALDADMFHCYVDENGLCKVSHQNGLIMFKRYASGFAPWKSYTFLNNFNLFFFNFFVIPNMFDIQRSYM